MKWANRRSATESFQQVAVESPQQTCEQSGPNFPAAFRNLFTAPFSIRAEVVPPPRSATLAMSLETRDPDALLFFFFFFFFFLPADAEFCEIFWTREVAWPRVSGTQEPQETKC